MYEISARLNLEHVDLAAEFSQLRALLHCTLDLLFALWRPHVQVLDGRERRAFRGSNDHVGSDLPDLCKHLLTTFVLAGIPDVAVWVGSGETPERNHLACPCCSPPSLLSAGCSVPQSRIGSASKTSPSPLPAGILPGGSSCSWPSHLRPTSLKDAPTLSSDLSPHQRLHLSCHRTGLHHRHLISSFYPPALDVSS